MHLRHSISYALALVTGALAGPPPSKGPRPRQAQPWKSTTISTHQEGWAFAFLPDGKVLINERRGNMKLVDPVAKGTPGAITGKPSNTNSDQNRHHNVALHPQYAENN